MGFRSLQHMPDAGVHHSRDCRARFVPRSGFGCPLRGLHPPRPGRLCFKPTALVGFSPRSIPSPEGRRIPAPAGPTCRFSARCSCREATGRNGRPRFLGRSCESPGAAGQNCSSADRRQLPRDSPFQGQPAKAFSEIPPAVLSRACTDRAEARRTDAAEYQSAIASPGREPGEPGRSRPPS